MAHGIALAEDGSMIVVGETDGSWDGANAGGNDFAAFRLDADGEEIWRYQVRTFLNVCCLSSPSG